MINLTCDTDKKLPRSDVDSIFQSLHIENVPDIEVFFANDEEYHTFYEFFFDVLIENRIPVAIDVDWRWTPDDIFWQLKNLLPEQNLELIDANESYDDLGNIKAWYVKYRLNTIDKDVTVDFNDPSQLLEVFEAELSGRQFIDINYSEDRYSWLVVPKDFDEADFCDRTGCESITYHKDAPLDIKPDEPQENKLFFYPELIFIKKDGDTYGVFCIDPVTKQAVNWAGRVLPGQTFREGIATELKDIFDYQGGFEYGVVSLRDEVKDKQGMDVKRYTVNIVLEDYPHADRTSHGADIQLYKYRDGSLWKMKDGITLIQL